MKNWKSLCLCLAALLCLLPFVAPKAKAAAEGDYTYTILDGNAKITDVDTSISGDITIPTTLGGYPVTTIGSFAFYQCRRLESITIPDSVTIIEPDAFSECTNLLSVTISGSVTTIGKFAFNECFKLNTVNIHEGVTTIGDYAFYKCTQLNTISIPESICSIGCHVFDNCTALTYNIYEGGKYLGNATNPYVALAEAPSATISPTNLHNNTRIIMDYSFEGSYHVNVRIPYRVTSISSYAFYKCKLQSISIPDSVTSIGDYAFYGCSSLQDISLPDGLTSIGRYAFASCGKLQGISIPDTVTYIGAYGFFCCSNLTSIAIPEGVTKISDYTFSGCGKLCAITFPEGLTTIGTHSFYDCDSLRDIALPNSLTSLGKSAFAGSSSLQTVVIGSGLHTINSEAFSSCSSLSSLTIPQSVTSISEKAFYGCSKLTSVYYEGSATQWSNVSIADNNKYLQKAAISCGHVHDYSLFAPVEVAATCTSTGYTQYTCIYGDTYRKYTVALGHSYNEAQTIVAPTCTAAGYTEKVCLRCAAILQTNYKNPIDHSYTIFSKTVQPTCSEAGYSVYQCAYCSGQTEKDQTVPIGHDFSGEVKLIQDPSCEEDGFSGIICSRCDAVEKTSVTNALGHDMVYIPETAATCTTDSKTAGTKCQRCETYFVVPAPIPGTALGHSFTNYIPNNDATPSTNGTKTAKCDRCDATDTVEDEGSKLSGKCGDNLTWAIAADGTLTITGTGAMYDYSYDTATTETDIPWYAYRKEITALSIGAGVTRIGKWAFRDFSSLTSLMIPNGVTEIGAYAFWICTGLESVELPTSANTIGTHAFYKCTALTQVTIPAGVTAVPGNAFYQCTKLETVTLPRTLTDIGNSAFRGCSALKNVYFTGTLEQWNTITVGTYNTPLTNATLHYHVHSFTNYVSNNDATYFEDGTKTAKCDTCDVTDTVTDPGTKLPLKENTIISQPKATTADSGIAAQFQVIVCGDVVSYKWQYRKLYKWFDTFMDGYNTDTLTVTATGARNGYDYRCVITLANGTVLYSEPAKLTVNTTIDISRNLSDQTVVLSYKGQFTVSAEGESLKYQWEYKRPNGELWIETAMEGATKPTVYVESTNARDGYQYRCRITDAAGKIVYTEPATMRVLSFKSHPETVFSGPNMDVTFRVETSVDTGFTYQWQYSANGGTKWSNTAMTGYNTDTLTVKTTLARNGYLYRCVLTGSKSSKIESRAATLYVANPVTVMSQPRSVTVLATSNAVFTVSAANVYSYQWYYSKNGTNWYATAATGNKTDTLTVAASGKNGYQYRCKLIGYDGSEVYTNAVTLTVR